MVLERLADYTDNRQQLRSRTLSAMLYPVMLFVVCVAIVFFLLVSVVPKVVEVFRTDDARTGVASFLEHGPGKATFTGH